jgi:glyoxylase-like metal-dependent hydrolase (beta-lactamase superfamily II)
VKIHHLSCGTQCPRGARVIAGKGGLFARASLVCHCLLIETDTHGLVLVDTGFGLADVRDPKGRLGRTFMKLTSPQLREEDTAIRQIERLGFKPSDVRHILITHLDADHAGGMSDFPEASIHVFSPEHEAATRRRSFIEKERYRPAQWAHNPKWAIHPAGGASWKGFRAIHALESEEHGACDDILMIPLVGHSRGHSGIAVRNGNEWLLHAGDAYFHHGEMDPTHPRCPKGLEVFQRLVQFDGRARLDNQARLRALAADPSVGVSVFCAHDPSEFQVWQGRQTAKIDT